MRSRGISTETSRRLCTRAPCTAMLVLGALRAGFLLVIRRFRRKERELLKCDVAAPRQQNRRRRLPDQAGVRQILARRRDALDAVCLLEMVLDVAARADVAVIAQV